MTEDRGNMNVGRSQNSEALALHTAKDRVWTRMGEGVELSIVGRDARTGSTAMFERIERTEQPQLEANLHSHVADCITLVLSGAVEIAFESETLTLNAGDFLRVPAGVPHTQALVSDQAVMFVMTQGEPGIEFAEPGPWSARTAER